MPMKLIKSALLTPIQGVIHYGDVIDAEIADYEFHSVKKLIWIHPNISVVSDLYPKTASRNYRSQFITVSLSNKDTINTKTLSTYITENILYVNLDNFNVIKINTVNGVENEPLKIVEGFGNLLSKYQTIRAVCVDDDSRDIEKYFQTQNFDKTYTVNNCSLYVRKGS